MLFNTWIEGEWSVDDNKLVLEEKKNEEQHLAGMTKGNTTPARLRFEWHYRILQLDSVSLVLLVHHRKPDFISGHAMEINNGDTLFYKSQR
jgi:hypothetical protein